MAETPSTMAPLGMKAPSFRLPDTSGKPVALDDFPSAPALVVPFICNHCPFVQHIRQQFAEFARSCRQRGVAVVAISSNDVAAFPEDAPDKMAQEARAAGYTFPYLYDESQEVAKAYHAACTPDFYLFDGSVVWCTAASSMTAVRATASRSPAPTCGARWTPSLPAAPCPRSRGPAWAATSNGKRATPPTTTCTKSQVESGIGKSGK